MTTRERFNNIMQFKPVDRLPVFEVESITEQAVRAWIKYEDYPIDHNAYAFFRLDYKFWNLNFADQSPIPCFLPEIIEQNQSTVTTRDQFGFLVKDFVKQGISPRHYIYVGAPLKTREDWEKMKSRFDPADKRRMNPYWLPEQIGKFNEGSAPVILGMNMGPARGIKNGYMFGFEKFMELIMDDPGLFKDMFNFWSDFIIKFIDTHFEGLKLDAFVFAEDGMGYNFSTLVSPAMFRDIYKPYIRRVVDHLSRKGVKTFGYYSSGNLKPLFPALIESGINFIMPAECQAFMDVVELSSEFGRDMAYIGNISRQAVMDGKDAIDRELEKKLDVMFERGGFIPAIDDQIFPDMRFENVKYCIDRMQDWNYRK